MKTYLLFLLAAVIAVHSWAQTEPAAGSWKTWFIKSGEDHRLPAPAPYKTEIAEVISRQKNIDAADLQQIIYWNAGAPGYHWHEMMSKIWVMDTSYNGALE